MLYMIGILNGMKNITNIKWTKIILLEITKCIQKRNMMEKNIKNH